MSGTPCPITTLSGLRLTKIAVVITLKAFLVLASGLILASDCWAGALTVCEAVMRSPTLSGRVVRIKGAWVAGMEQTMLRAYDCSSTVSLSGREWPAAIDLRVSSLGASRSLMVRKANIERAYNTVRLSKNAEFLGVVIVTLKGLIQPASIDGFGHLGALPARLLLLDAEKPTVIWTKEKNPLWGVPLIPWQ